MSTPLTRRDFLKAGGLALAAANLPSTARSEDAAPAPAKKRDIKKGIMWGSVPAPLSIMDKFKLFKEAGFAGTEIDSGMDRAEVLKARDATGMLIPSVVCSTHWAKPLSDPNPAVREASLEGLKTA